MGIGEKHDINIAAMYPYFVYHTGFSHRTINDEREVGRGRAWGSRMEWSENINLAHIPSPKKGGGPPQQAFYGQYQILVLTIKDEGNA